jgi:hypothetical protein
LTHWIIISDFRTPARVQTAQPRGLGRLHNEPRSLHQGMERDAWTCDVRYLPPTPPGASTRPCRPVEKIRRIVDPALLLTLRGSRMGGGLGAGSCNRRINRFGPCGRVALGQRWRIDWPGWRSWRRQVRPRWWVGYWVMHGRIDGSRRRSWRVRLRRRLRGIGMRYGRVGIHDRTPL